MKSSKRSIVLNQLKHKFQQVSDIVLEQAGNLGETAKEKSLLLIKEWLQVFPILEAYGLKITSFGIGVGISPSLEVELKGSQDNFTKEKIKRILIEHKGNTPITSVFKTIQMTRDFHDKISDKHSDVIIVKVFVKIPPLVKVFLGEPAIQ
jgi:hypothetical protein